MFICRLRCATVAVDDDSNDGNAAKRAHLDQKKATTMTASPSLHAALRDFFRSLAQDKSDCNKRNVFYWQLRSHCMASKCIFN